MFNVCRRITRVELAKVSEYFTLLLLKFEAALPKQPILDCDPVPRVHNRLEQSGDHLPNERKQNWRLHGLIVDTVDDLRVQERLSFREVE